MDLLIGDVFDNAARAAPSRVAAALDDRALTFAEVDRRANQIARALLRRGLEAGDTLAVWASTDLDLVPVFAGAAKAGVIFAPISGALSDAEAAVVLESAAPSLVVTDRDGGGDAVPLDALGDGEDDGPVERVSIRERDPHVVFFTSGSSGRPKGVVLSHRANWLRSTSGPLLEPRGTMLCPYPLFHMAAWTLALQQWQARDAVVFVRAADAASICAVVERDAVARLNCVPAVWRRILDHPGHPDALRSIRFADTGTSATPVELLEAIAAACPNATVRVFYGSTEAGGVTCLEHADIARKPGSVGLPGPSVQIRVDDSGELWCCGPALFDGYLGEGDPLVDGWYPTGDLAEIDEEGYVTIVGRARDVIRSGGETVAPPEVEAVILTHPAIDDVAVIGLPDARWGEIVCAVIVAAEPPTVEELRTLCAARLARYKHPRRVEVVAAIPRTASTGQVQRALLVERFS